MKLEDAKNALRGMVPDFAARMAPVYRVLDWRWHTHDLDYSFVPDEDDIETCLNRLIDDLSEPGEISTGGLHVQFSEKNHEASIAFAAEEIYYFDKSDTYEPGLPGTE